MAADGSIVLTTKVDTTGVSNASKTIGGTLGTALKGVTAAATATAAAVAAVTAAVVNGAKETAEYGDRVDKMSQKLGFSAEKFQEWDYIMKINGSSVESLQGGMKTLANKAQSNAAAFKQLGLSEEFVKTASPEELFEETVKTLQTMPQSTERAALAQSLLGRSAQELAPLLNAENGTIEELAQTAHDYGMVMSDDAVSASAAFQDSLTKLEGTTKGLKNKFMAEFLPSITAITDGLSLLFAGKDGGLEKIQEGVYQFTQQLSKLLPQLVKIGVGIAKSLLQAFTDNAPELIKAVVGLLPDIVNAIIELVKGIVAALPTIIQTLVEALPSVIESLVAALPELIPQIITAIYLLITMLLQYLPDIIMPIIEALPDIIIAINEAVLQNLPLLIKGLVTLVIKLVAALPQILAALFEALVAVVQNVVDIFSMMWDGLVELFSGVGEWFGERFNEAWENISEIWSTVGNWFADRWNEIVEVFSVVGTWFKERFDEAWQNIVDSFAEIGEFFSGLWDGIKKVFAAVDQFFGGIFSSAWQNIKNSFAEAFAFFANLWNGIKDAGKGALNGLIGIVEGALNFVIDLLNKFISGLSSITEAVGSIFGADWSIKPISHINIPRLATGGIVPAATIAQIGERGAEAVLPLENNTEWMDMLAARLAGVLGAVGGTPVILEIDGRELGRATLQYGGEAERLRGASLVVR